MTTDADADAPAPLDGRVLVLRADATTAGGTGHMMRMLALSQAWLDAGGRARWLVAAAPPALIERIEDEGVAIVRLDGPAGGETDAAARSIRSPSGWAAPTTIRTSMSRRIASGRKPSAATVCAVIPVGSAPPKVTSTRRASGGMTRGGGAATNSRRSRT